MGQDIRAQAKAQDRRIAIEIRLPVGRRPTTESAIG